MPISLVGAGPEERAVADVPAVSAGAVAAAAVPGEAASVEITLPKGCRLRVDQRVDTRVLRRIVAGATIVYRDGI